jgi:tetratricopeptide (TPR) repeat protein
MDFEQNLNEIHAQYRERIQNFQNELFGQALGLFQADIQNPLLTRPDAPPDAFMLRANRIGLALLENGFFSVAERLYRVLAEETLKYRNETGNWRHAGALFANTGTACAAQGNFDKAVVELLRAVREDERTYKVAPHDSFAIKGLLQEYFGKPIRSTVLAITQQVTPSIKIDDIEDLSRILGSNEYAFLSYAYIAVTHEEAKKVFSNDFSHLQILTALRNLSALLEVVLKNFNGNTSATFFPTIQSLFSAKSWWQDFENTRRAVGATQNSGISADNQLGASININPTDNNSRFWKSLLIAYITRNYTAHQMDFSSTFIQKYSQEALGHILSVMIVADKYI